MEWEGGIYNNKKICFRSNLPWYPGAQNPIEKVGAMKGGTPPPPPQKKLVTMLRLPRPSKTRDK